MAPFQFNGTVPLLLYVMFILICDRCKHLVDTKHLMLGFRCRSGPGDKTERTLVSHSACIDFRLFNTDTCHIQ